MKNPHLKTWNSILILSFGGRNFISKFWKSFSLIPLESHFETIKFEFSDLQNPQIYIFAAKLKFFFYQNLDFVLIRFFCDPDEHPHAVGPAPGILTGTHASGSGGAGPLLTKNNNIDDFMKTFCRQPPSIQYDKKTILNFEK